MVSSLTSLTLSQCTCNTSSLLWQLCILREQGNFLEAVAIASKIGKEELMLCGLSRELLAGEALICQGFLDKAEATLRAHATTMSGPGSISCCSSSSIMQDLEIWQDSRLLLAEIQFQRQDYRAAVAELEQVEFTELSARLTVAVEAMDRQKLLLRAGRSNKSASLVEAARAVQSARSAVLLAKGAVVMAKCCQMLQRMGEAVCLCSTVAAAVEEATRSSYENLPWAALHLQPVALKALLLLPELYRLEGRTREVREAYRRLLNGPIKLESEMRDRVEMQLGLVLIYGLARQQEEGEGEGGPDPPLQEQLPRDSFSIKISRLAKAMAVGRKSAK